MLTKRIVLPLEFRWFEMYYLVCEECNFDLDNLIFIILFNCYVPWCCILLKISCNYCTVGKYVSVQTLIEIWKITSNFIYLSTHILWCWCEVGFECFKVPVMDKAGRRMLLLLQMVVMVLILALITIAVKLQINPNILIFNGLNLSVGTENYSSIVDMLVGS